MRARLNVLSEMPRPWEAALQRWAEMNAGKKTPVEGAPAPDRNEEYLLYQTLLGVWPDGVLDEGAIRPFRDRLVGYMEKATREAKVHTSWVNPNQAYDAAVRDFVSRLLPDDPEDPFLTDLAEFAKPVAFFGRVNSLSQTLLKLTCPGVPDFYQGTEMWSLALVDPDNRRPVDYDCRRTALAELKGGSAKIPQLSQLAKDLLAANDDGRVKLYLTHRLLAFRAQYPALFDRGDYVPLECRGERGEHVCAFSRSQANQNIVVVVPRLVLGLMGGQMDWPLGTGVWKDTKLKLPAIEPGAIFQNVLTGETVRSGGQRKRCDLSVGAILKSFPVALLERQESPS